jgi:ribulose-phosphate 3-epimerase
MTIQIVPAILPESFDDIASHAARVRGFATRMQIDVANGSYAPTTTWPYTRNEHLASLISQNEGLPFWEDLSYEVDMLIRQPEAALDTWINVGVAGAIVHIESTNDHSGILQKARTQDIELGWGIKPSTPNERLFEIVDLHGMPDFVQCMGNDTIGHSGIELDPQVYEKVADISARYPGLPIAVDIGVNADTAPELVEAGATKLVAGTAVFGALDVKEAIENLQS